MPKTEQSRKILLAKNEEEHQIFGKIVHKAFGQENEGGQSNGHKRKQSGQKLI